MTSNNEHIEDYLKYYCDFPEPPGFAVMIKGAWGAGKTHLVKKFFEAYNEKKEGSKPPLYVSLYGKTQLSQIDDVLLQQLHPVLSSKVTKFVGSLAVGVLKKYTEVDFDTDEIKIPDYLCDTTDRILVFDDLERCSMPVEDVLGYINNFVEHGASKILVIANEDEIIRLASINDKKNSSPSDAKKLEKNLTAKDDQSRYEIIKEKLIGKTLEVVPEFDDAFVEFVDLVSHKDLPDIYKTKREEIRGLFAGSGGANLRILRQTMWDFERLFSLIDEKYWKNPEAFNSIFGVFFALSFELRLGRATAKTIDSIQHRYLLAASQLGDHSAREIAERYPSANWDQTLIEWPQLKDILTRGIIDVGRAVASLNRHPYFADQAAEPNWRKIWYGQLKGSAEELEKALSGLGKEIDDRVFTEAGEILHVAGISLWLAKINAVDLSQSDVVIKFKDYIDDIYKKKKLSHRNFLGPLDDREFNFSGWQGLSFYQGETTEFATIKQHLLKTEERVFEDELPALAASLLQDLTTDPHLFYRRICYSNSADNIYAEVPLLKFIEPKEFVDKLLALSRESQRMVLTGLKSRYEMSASAASLSSERDWVKSIYSEILDQVKNQHPIIRTAIVGTTETSLGEVIKRMPKA